MVGQLRRTDRRCCQPRGPAASVATAHRQRRVFQRHVACSLFDSVAREVPEVQSSQPINGISQSGSSSSSSSARGGADASASGAGAVKTRFIAETLLPTRHGRFRLRGYKHSVRRTGVVLHGCTPLAVAISTNAISTNAPDAPPQVDGGVTFTEPTAIICGEVEGKADVRVPGAARAGRRHQCRMCSTPMRPAPPSRLSMTLAPTRPPLCPCPRPLHPCLPGARARS